MATVKGAIVVWAVIRVASFVYSLRNERRLREAGAEEYGKRNSDIFWLTVTAYFGAGFVEAALYPPEPSAVRAWAALVLVASQFVHVAVVWSLRDVWSMRVLILPDHRLEAGWVFRHIRHPNYFLSLVPELVAFSIALNAWRSLAVFGAPMLVSLAVRIWTEERALRVAFDVSYPPR